MRFENFLKLCYKEEEVISEETILLNKWCKLDNKNYMFLGTHYNFFKKVFISGDKMKIEKYKKLIIQNQDLVLKTTKLVKEFENFLL